MCPPSPFHRAQHGVSSVGSEFLLRGTDSSFPTCSASSRDRDALRIQALAHTSHRQGETINMLLHVANAGGKYSRHSKANATLSRWTSAGSSIKPPSPTPPPSPTAVPCGSLALPAQKSRANQASGAREALASSGRKALRAAHSLPGQDSPQTNTWKMARVSHPLFCHHRLSDFIS